MALFSYTGDTVTAVVAVKDVFRDPLDLTGATVTAAATREDDEVAGTCDVTSAESGIVTVSFNVGALTAGFWVFQVRVVQSGYTRVVVSETLGIHPAF